MAKPGLMRGLLQDESGATVIEYALIIFLIGLGVGTVAAFVGLSVNDLTSYAGGILETAVQKGTAAK